MEAEHVLSCRDPGEDTASLEMAINRAQFAGEPVAVAAILSGFSPGALAHLLFPLTGGVERAACAREPGTLAHFGPGHTVPASKGDRSTRSSEGSRCWWGTSTRANALHLCRNRRHTL